MALECPQMTLKSFSDIQALTIKKWAVHRADGLLLKFTLADTRLGALEKFLKRKYPATIIFTPTLIEKLWRYWHKFNDVNELNLTSEQFHALVNENPHG